VPDPLAEGRNLTIMNSILKKIIAFILVFLLGAVLYLYLSYGPQLPVASGYAAKKMCSCHFIAGRSQKSIQNTDLGTSPLNLTKSVIDEDEKSVTTSVYGLGKMKAIYKDELGCVLIQGDNNLEVELDLPDRLSDGTQYWPHGIKDVDYRLDGIDYEKLNTAIDKVFLSEKKTRAVVIIHRDTLITERYADGFDKHTEILGWSMTKSVTSTLLGILHKNGLLDIDETPGFGEWAHDTRKDIKLRHLLDMQSGLKFDEVYDQVSDATKMLFGSEASQKQPIAQKTIAPPDSIWNYSSGTTNLLQYYLKSRMDNHDAYLRFPYTMLFNRVGMNSAVMETDESGLYIGSSYMYATPRDWAKFGQLYLNEGNWYGDQILDTAWVDYSQTIASQSGGIYGAHFWHNADHSAYPDVPSDLYSANGFQGQYVFIIPSRDLVVVRMGLDYFDENAFLAELLTAFND